MNLDYGSRDKVVNDFLHEAILGKEIAKYCRGAGFVIKDSKRMEQLIRYPDVPVSRVELSLAVHLYDSIPDRLTLGNLYTHSTGEYPLLIHRVGIFDPIPLLIHRVGIFDPM